MTEAGFWALSAQAESSSITRSRLGQLAKLANDFDKAERILKAALKTKNPSAYLGKVIKNLKTETESPLSILRSEEPEIVLQARLHGWPVRRLTRSNGEPGWYVAGSLVDQRGVDVGA